MILYAGNILSKFGFTPTFIETLAPKLSEHYKLISVSQKKSKVLRMLDMMNAVRKNKKELDLVLIDSYSVTAFWYTYIIAGMCIHYGIPYIPILRGGGYAYRLKQSPGLCNKVFSNSYKNVSPSLYLKDHFEEAGYEVEYIPNFIPIKNYEYKLRKSVRPKLFWVRSFHEIYNPLLAIDILLLLKRKYPDAELCMVGPDKDGSLKKFTDKAEVENISSSIKITGRLTKKEWIDLSRDYDIFINTTNFDNHPVSVIEAMAVGLPVVSTNVGGIPYLIENNVDGLLVNPDNANEFINAIERIMTDEKLLLTITLNARRKVEEFDWEVIKDKWFKLIDPVAKNSKIN